MTQAHKDAISRGQIKRHQKAREEFPDFIPPGRRCNICKTWKSSDKFSKKKFKRKDGHVTITLAYMCNECAVEKSRKRRQKLKEEGRYSELRHREYKNAMAKNGDKIRERQRERTAIKRREEGKKVNGAWSKYRVKEKDPNLVLLPLTPIQTYLKNLNMTTLEISHLTGINKGIIAKIISGTEKSKEKKTVAESTVDRILVGMGEPHKFDELYPLDV